MAQDTDRLFNTDDWVEVYRTTDEWEAKLIQATLGNQQIRCRPEYKRANVRHRQIVLSVAPEDEVEALEIVSRIGLAVTTDEYETRQRERGENRGPEKADAVVDARAELPKVTPTAVEEVIVAEREGIGRIVHYVGRGYELQVGPEPYYTVEESRWEEFTDFSAQRQEFAILLKHEYPELFKWLKGEKLMAEFIHLVEATYREVPPPRPRQQRREPSSPARDADSTETPEVRVSNLAKFSLWVALVSLAAVVLQLPWYASLTLAILAAVSGFVARYRIGASNGALKGTPIAFLAVIIACIVIAITWKQHRPTPSKALESSSAYLLVATPNQREAPSGIL